MYRALIAEKEPVLRLTLTHFLEESGAEVHAARNGREAYLRCMACEPDIVISSLRLALDGDREGSLISALRREFPELPIMAVSGSDEERNDELAYRLGANSLLRKPIDGESLVENVAALLQPETRSWELQTAIRLDHENLSYQGAET